MNEIAKKYDAVVIGAGIIGVTTASMLRRNGLSVLVVEASAMAAEQTSAANAGELSYGYSGPWATPGLLAAIPGMLRDPNGPLRIRPDDSFAGLMRQLQWGRWFAMNTSAKRFETNKRRILQLSRLSAAQQEEFDVPGSAWAHQKLGTLQLFRSHAVFQKVLRNDLPTLRASGVNVVVADVAQCVTQEPGLADVASKIVGGLIFTDDQTGDCAAFTRELAKQEQAAGVDFAYSTAVQGIDIDKFGVRSVATSKGRFYAKRVVACAGYWTTSLLHHSCGLRVPIYPVRGYSLTVQTPEGEPTVTSTILDEMSKVALTRLSGNTLRVAGTAEICNPNRPADPRRMDLLAQVTAELFPTAISATTDRGMWYHGRPMTPDGTPVIGATVVPGLFINAGHGTLGWTQSFGSARQVADVVVGRVPLLDPTDYELSRYGHSTSKWKNYFKLPTLRIENSTA